MTFALVGLVAGAVHVLSGPDHLAAIAPYAVTDKARSWLTGIRWGLGHTAGVLGVGLLVLVTRRALPIETLSAGAELSVGVALVGIGAWGIRGVLRRPDHPGSLPHTRQHHHHVHAAMGVGTLHGLAGSSHLLGILPALALPSNGAACAYLFCFGLGSVAAMGTFASLIGWIAGRPRASGAGLRRALLGLSSIMAVAVGGFWVLSSLPVNLFIHAR